MNFSKGIVDASAAIGARAKGALNVAMPLAYSGMALGLLKNVVAKPTIEAINIMKSRKDMMSKYPNLGEEDPEVIKDYFDVVRTFSPKAASNPLVAGSIVNKLVQFGGVDHKLIQDLGSIQSDSDDFSNKINLELIKGFAKNYDMGD